MAACQISLTADVMWTSASVIPRRHTPSVIPFLWTYFPGVPTGDRGYIICVNLRSGSWGYGR